jgi:uncharacterized membrane protein (UPF0182 family)
MEKTLAESLNAIYAGLPAEELPSTAPTTPEKPTDKLAELAKLAQEHYDKAQDYLKEGDWTGWGEELDKMAEVLRQLVELTESQQ